MFGFPRDREKKEAWVRALPDQITVDEVTSDMGVCAIHFPGAKMRKAKGGHFVPDEPPTYFPAVLPGHFLLSSTTLYLRYLCITITEIILPFYKKKLY